MSTVKIAISVEHDLLTEIDEMVKNKVFPSRSKAIQKSIEEKLARMKKTRLARECSKLDIKFEQALAEEGISMEIEQWPEY